jgi:hypothetical protein
MMPPDASQARLRYPMRSLTVMCTIIHVNVASTLDENSSWAVYNSAERLPPATFRELGPAELQDVNDFCRLKRLFVCSAVTKFYTTNTSSDTAPIGGAGSGVFGLVSFACGGPRFDSLGVSLLFSRGGPASSNNMVASNVTRWLRAETRVWIGNKQARTFLQLYRHMKERGKS